jgi:hypothetical protein
MSNLKPMVLLLFSLWLFWGFGYETVAKRLSSHVEGTVISRREMAYPLAPARYSAEYIVRGLDGHNQSYVAGPTDASLPRTIALGTNLRKLPWHWSYEENGQVTDTFGWVFYAMVLAIATACLVWSVMLRSPKNRLS